ncbi:MAG: NADH-quinone oxidoreductase subunit NuoE [Acidobacteria bacterium]|nr:NADH-quinone oxidoreductase subunit NuoE [Acidobacteriota bacterium]
MLSPEERADLDRELADGFPTARSKSIDALKILQRHRRWVSDEALVDLEAYLGLSRAELDNVATFYNLIFRQPVGRHVILLCDSVSCWICGYEGILEALRERLGIGLGETTPDDRFTLLPMACLGCCDGAPALMIDEDLHRDLRPEGLDELLEAYP